MDWESNVVELSAMVDVSECDNERQSFIEHLARLTESQCMELSDRMSQSDMDTLTWSIDTTEKTHAEQLAYSKAQIQLHLLKATFSKMRLEEQDSSPVIQQ